MPRPKYPSDARRSKQRPHVKVHLTWWTHPCYAAAWKDPMTRGIVVGIWEAAARAHASSTEDEVTLSTGLVMVLTGCSHAPAALQRLRKVCAAMDYPLRSTDAGWVIHVRNFAKKQGFTPQLRSVATPTPHPSDSEFRVPSQLVDAVHGFKTLELDLSHIGEMDTAGFQLLVMAKHESQRLDHALRIVAHSPAVREVIEFYNMVAFFGDPLVIPAERH